MQAEIDQATAHLKSLEVVDYKAVEYKDKVLMETLMNPLILDKVFSFLNTKTLKSVRLVCPTWADVGAKFLGKKGRLTFSTLPNRRELTTFHPNLAKNVNLYMKCYCYYRERCTCSPDECKTSRNLPPNFAMVLPKICDKLATLRFSVRRTYEPHMCEMWSTYNFPNLALISIYVMTSKFDDHDDLPLVEVGQFRPLPNLKVFSLEISYRYFCGAILSSICQGLLNSAPNLEKFELTANLYPDLTPCRKLKELRFAFVEYRDQFTRATVQMDITRITRMLEGCANSLDKLALRCQPQSRNVAALEKLNFNLPNLTHLAIYAPELFKIEDSLDFAHLPRLTHFSIRASDSYVLSTMFANYNLRHVGITSLQVECAHCADLDSQDRQAAAKLVSLFPAVKEFKLKLAIFYLEDFSTLKETMQSFGGWDLTSGDVELDLDLVLRNYSDTEIVIAALEGLMEWRGLTNTSLRFSRYAPDLTLKLTDRMRAALLACRTLRCVTFDGFKFAEGTVGAFIRQNNLPICFVEGLDDSETFSDYD